MLEPETLLDPIARLTYEHRQIDRVLVAISEVTIRVGSGGVPEHEFFAATVDFIERYADGCHHTKEEGALFEEIWAQGFSRTGPLACMVSQHELGRDLTGKMRDWVNGSSSSRATNSQDLLTATAQYTNLLWNHIATEDEVIFPAVRNSLPEEALAHIAARYQKLDPRSPVEFRLAADNIVALAGAASVERALAASHASRR